MVDGPLNVLLPVLWSFEAPFLVALTEPLNTQPSKNNAGLTEVSGPLKLALGPYWIVLVPVVVIVCAAPDVAWVKFRKTSDPDAKPDAPTLTDPPVRVADPVCCPK